jgi:cytochrome c-type biogenesis protein CcmH
MHARRLRSWLDQHVGGLIAIFWFIAGALVGVGAALVAMPLWRGALALGRGRLRYGLAGAFVATFAGAAAIIYVAIGSRHSLASRPAAAAVVAPAAESAADAASKSGASAKSMETEVTALEARLARDGGSADDWTLLAKAYDFLGRPDDARRARSRAANPAAGVVTQMNAGALVAAATATETRSTERTTAAAATAASLAELEQRVKTNPRDVSGWLALADLHRAQHDNGAARDALAKVVALKGMTAQSWADYADVLASLAGGSLTGAAGSAIDSALALDAGNPKALWLKASQAHEQRHFADALTWWKRLRSALPAGSPDASIIDGNIAEDTSLAGLAPVSASAAGAATPAATAAAEVSGTVSIDSRLADRVQRDATLFIYAKAADSPGPPLAVLRTTAAAWPVSFHLDDSMAMIPSRRLSQFDKVVVEARISRSGQATPSSGDLYVTSPVLHPAAGKKLALIINREIG